MTRGARVTGVTLSAEQARYAAEHPVPGVDVQVRDWLDNPAAGQPAGLSGAAAVRPR
ncbi:hypothetical protein [Pseudarthrobacter enclensis]|uniref:Uncharacterized protein n=1 Tax=Pseudarthrobacter enclensis TaxID=993070 RepID=A0ABT9RU51_9MICC|nr:hypothetical protein [Pseudarthrobacter enclensis]MDP9888310.1 hypothetical protein [Pseudarthrobacter enclensis]